MFGLQIDDRKVMVTDIATLDHIKYLKENWSEKKLD
jgi:hypothetical protein